MSQENNEDFQDAFQDAYVITDVKTVNKFKKFTKKTYKTIVYPLVFSIVIAVIVLILIFVPKVMKYHEADKLISDDQIIKAVRIYKELGNFKDSESLAEGGAYYKYAKLLVGEKKYKEAAIYYDKAANYNYKEAAKKKIEAYYKYGKQLLEQGLLEEAQKAFYMSSSYKDAKTLYKECSYEKAVALFEEEDYEEAIAILDKIENYEDAEVLLDKCIFLNAKELYDNKNYEEAYEEFIKTNYGDAKDMAGDAAYKVAKEAYKAKKYEVARTYYQKANEETGDCISEIDNCNLVLGDNSLSSKNYKAAIDYYLKVETIDVSDKITKAKLEYIKKNESSSDFNTMEYLCELKYTGNPQAKEIYAVLAGWDITSRVNGEEKDSGEGVSTISGDKDIYIHTNFHTDGDDTLGIRARVVFENGTATDFIDLGDAVNGYTTCFHIETGQASKGEASFYIFTKKSSKLIEKYTFTIE